MKSRIQPILTWILVIIGVLVILRVLAPNPPEKPTPPKTRTEQVQVVDWSNVDQSIKTALEDAKEIASAHAEQAVSSWVDEVTIRSEEDFLPWYFAYWNQQVIGFRAIGFALMDTPLVESMVGKQQSAQERTEAWLQQAFSARVLHPRTAQAKVDAITRKAVKVYLKSLQGELKSIQAEYKVTDQDWDRHLAGISEVLLSVESNRQIPLTLKGMTVGSGVAAVKIGTAMTSQIKHLISSGTRGSIKCVGRQASRGLGWVAFGIISTWDCLDHYKTVAQNKPIMRRLLHDNLEGLKNQVLNEVSQTLERVRQSIMQ